MDLFNLKNSKTLLRFSFLFIFLLFFVFWGFSLNTEEVFIAWSFAFLVLSAFVLLNKLMKNFFLFKANMIYANLIFLNQTLLFTCKVFHYQLTCLRHSLRVTVDEYMYLTSFLNELFSEFFQSFLVLGAKLGIFYVLGMEVWYFQTMKSFHCKSVKCLLNKAFYITISKNKSII